MSAMFRLVDIKLFLLAWLLWRKTTSTSSQHLKIIKTITEMYIIKLWIERA